MKLAGQLSDMKINTPYMIKQIYNLLLTLLISFLMSGHLYAQTIQIQGEQTGIIEADTVLLAGEVLVPENGGTDFFTRHYHNSNGILWFSGCRKRFG